MSVISVSSIQGICADQSKVCGYHRFQQADFSEGVLAELRKLFEARSELLHQKVALHAYTAQLSRLQVESYLYHLLTGDGLLTSCLDVTVLFLIWKILSYIFFREKGTCNITL